MNESNQWSDQVPSKEGYYWFYGSHVSIDREIKLHHVKIETRDGELIVACYGNLVSLSKWESILPEYYGLWMFNDTPKLPKVISCHES